MLWTLDNPPDIAKGKSEEQVKACLAAIEKSLDRDPLDEEGALLSGLQAMRVAYKKTMPQKASKSQQESVKPKPTHVPTLKAKDDLSLPVEPLKPSMTIPLAFKGHSLPLGIDRNVVAANFDSADKLVILFDTGERITTKPFDIKQYIQSNVTVSQGEGGSSPITYTIREVYGDTTTTAEDQVIIVRDLATITLHEGQAGVVEAPIRIKRITTEDVTITDVDQDGYVLNVNYQAIDVQWTGSEWIGL